MNIGLGFMRERQNRIDKSKDYDGVKILSIASIKGGVGKTGAAVCISGAYAEKFPDHKVLLMDGDPQGNSSKALGLIPKKMDNNDMYALYSYPNISIRSCLHETGVPNLFCIPTAPNLTNFKISFEESDNKEYRENAKRILRRKLEDFKQEACSKKEKWLVLIDTRPDVDLFTVNAFIASDRIITPVSPCEFAVDGFKIVFRMVESVRLHTENKSLRVLGLFRSKWDKAGSINTQRAESELTEMFPRLLMKTIVPNQVAVPNAFHERLPVNFSKGNKNGLASKAYMALLEEVLERWDVIERLEV